MKYLILGYGVTGKSVENYLTNQNADYLIFDDLKENLNKVHHSKIFSEKNIDLIDIVIISPGIKPDHHLLEQLMSKNVSVKTDIDIFSEHYKGNVIGVTGTNGKTTFVNELNKFLNINNVHSASAGNIGISPLDLIDTSYEYIILELSSYQLHYTSNLNLDMAVILNIFPDHIDWHESVNNYASSKIKILSFLSEGKSERKIIGSNMGIVKTNLPNNIDIKSKNNLKVHRELLLSLGEATRKIGGVELYNRYIEYIEKYEIKLPHRMEQFLKLKNKNITFFNDSKATNYHAVSEASKLFTSGKEDGILILHGITKETNENKLNIDPVFKYVIIPEDMNTNLGDHNAEIIHIKHISNLKDILVEILSKNQVVLFSCGGSSFNDFENYQVRGDYFKNLILSMQIQDA